MSGGRVTGGVVVGLLGSLVWAFFAVIVGLVLASTTRNDRGNDVLFVIPFAIPLLLALVGSVSSGVRSSGGGFLIGVLWGLVPLTAVVAVVVVASGIHHL